jgi:deazaflavin-dependent oxidoreductase (nitroreductase family)
MRTAVDRFRGYGRGMTDDEVVDSPTGWVAKHIQRYAASDGTNGYLYMGVPTLLLTTRGRRSGTLRRTALMYGEDAGRYLLVASNGGSATHPAWYLNLTANPEVEVQIKNERFAARAHTASAAERQVLWKVVSDLFPTYDRYLKTAAKKGREIPLIILERI